MFSEFPASKNTNRLVRAVMCLDSENAPKGYFLTPAIKRSGIVVVIKDNVNIKSVDNEIVPPQASFKGVYDIPYFFSYLGPSVTTFAADLHPIGLYELTKKPGSIFKNEYVDLNEVWDKEEVNELISSLSQHDLSLEKRATIFDQFIETKIEGEVSEKSVIVEKADQMAKERGYNLSLDDITDELIISRKTLERVFKEVIGITPKQYFSSAIFEEMIREYTINKELSVSGFLESPFYDFSHINKWFKKFTNTSPTDFASHDMDVIAHVLSKRV